MSFPRIIACMTLFFHLLSPALTHARSDNIQTNTENKSKENGNSQFFTNSVGMEFVLIPPGKLSLPAGPDARVSEIAVGKPFYLGKYEVTWEQLARIADIKDTLPHEKQKLPLVMISWNEVQEIIAVLNLKEGDTRYRLPTEMEWEYAARGGTGGKYFFTQDAPNITEEEVSSILMDYAWFSENSGNKIHPVGLKKPNQYGLYDMYGNVDEWVQDVYKKEFQPATPSRVIRGGNNSDNAARCNSVYRSSGMPNIAMTDVGFRLAFDPDTTIQADEISSAGKTSSASTPGASTKISKADSGADEWLKEDNPSVNEQRTPKDDFGAVEKSRTDARMQEEPEQKIAEYPPNERQPQDKAQQLQRSAEQGDADAQLELAVMYKKGSAAPGDVVWFQKVTDARVQYELGLLYEYGRGVPKDYVKAEEWYSKAASHGHDRARQALPITCYELGLKHERGRDVPLDYVKAAEWYQKAAAYGHAQAQYMLAVMYKEGRGVPKDARKAEELFQKSRTATP